MFLEFIFENLFKIKTNNNAKNKHVNSINLQGN